MSFVLFPWTLELILTEATLVEIREILWLLVDMRKIGTRNYKTSFSGDFRLIQIRCSGVFFWVVASDLDWWLGAALASKLRIYMTLDLSCQILINWAQ